MATAEVQGPAADRSGMNLTHEEEGLLRNYTALREDMVKELEEQKRETRRQEMQERRKQKEEQRAKQIQAEQSEMEEVKKKLQKGWEGPVAKTEFKRRGGGTRTSQPARKPEPKEEYDEFGILITPSQPKAAAPGQERIPPQEASPPTKKPRTAEPAPGPAPAPKPAPAAPVPARVPMAGRGAAKTPAVLPDSKPIGVKRQAPSVTNKAPKLANPYPTLDEMAVLRMKAQQAPGLLSVPTRKRKALSGAQAEAAANLAKKAAEHATLMPIAKAAVKTPSATDGATPLGSDAEPQVKLQSQPIAARPLAAPSPSDKKPGADPAPQPVRTAISTDKLPSILEVSPAASRAAPAAAPVPVKVEMKAVARSALMDEDEDEDYD